METESEDAQPSSRERGLGRVLGALASPHATFASIARKPSWFLPVFLIVIINLLLAFSLVHRGILQTALQNQMNSSPLYAQLTPQQRSQNVALETRLAPIESYVGAIVGTPIVLLIVAAVFLGAFNALFGAGIKFGQSFAVSAFASMPSLLKGLAGIALVWVRAPASVKPRDSSMSSLGAYLPAHAPVWLATLGAHLDVFTFWMLGLLAVGYAAASPKKLRFGSALAIVLVIWAVYVLVNVGVVSIIPRP